MVSKVVVVVVLLLLLLQERQWEAVLVFAEDSKICELGAQQTWQPA
jgi:hypothetical protein